MIEILMTQDFFLAYGVGWAIDVTDFMLSQCSNDSEIRCRPIVGLLEQVLQL